MTLDSGGSSDARIASQISARYGMPHQIVSLDAVRNLSPEEAHAACLEAARRLSCMADPVAFVALQMAEARVDQGPRLSGLGGEVARGFYYMPGQGDGPITAARVDRLTAWRMFANESVSAQALTPGFLDWAYDFAKAEVRRLLQVTGLPWRAATDRFYLQQRMQRWAGVTDTAVCSERLIVNPMLHPRFLELAEGLKPEHKAGARFLAQLQVELDEELAKLPLEGRPAPVTYAADGTLNRLRIAASTADKFAGKVAQRLRRERRSPAGGESIAQGVVQHWRMHPTALGALADNDILRAEWIDAVLSDSIDPDPGSVALLVNLLAARQ